MSDRFDSEDEVYRFLVAVELFKREPNIGNFENAEEWSATLPTGKAREAYEAMIDNAESSD